MNSYRIGKMKELKVSIRNLSKITQIHLKMMNQIQHKLVNSVTIELTKRKTW